MNNKLIITLELVQAIADYLKQRPFVEVFQLIAALSELPRFEEPAPELPTEKKA